MKSSVPVWIRSPLYSGVIKRDWGQICLQSRINRAVRGEDQHQIFSGTHGIGYPGDLSNGLATSLPMDIQVRMLRSSPAWRRLRLSAPGMPSEYDYADPLQLKPSLDQTSGESLFAGQINGTSDTKKRPLRG